MNRYFTFVKNTIKLKLFKKFFEQKKKKRPSEQAAQCCLPGGAQFYIELKFFSDCRQFLHNTLQFQTELLICQTLLLQLVS